MPEAEVERVEAPTPAPDVVRAGHGVLEAGGLLVHPTSTVYGLGGGSVDADAEVARLKGRPADEPFLRIAWGVQALRRERPDLRWTPDAERLARRFWPGPLTLILDDGTDRGLGVRVEAHPVTRAVLRRWGGSVSSTSLNRSGDPAAITPSEVRMTLDALPRPRLPTVWLDAGALPGGPPSTLLSLRHPTPRLLRSGAVDPGAIEEALDREVARG
ncbi:MAG: L-threonylcarbamoyladenylate synthase [Gemmatimonadota bacterium]